MTEKFTKAWEGIIKILLGSKNILGFWLTLICVCLTGYVAITKKPELISELPFILGVYLGARTLERGSHVWAASKDSAANTQEVIKEVNKE